MTGRQRPRLERSSAVAAAFAASLATVGFAACGVSTEPEAHVIPADEFPYPLQAEARADVAADPPDSGRSAVVFLLRGDELVEVPRSVTDPADLNSLLSELTGPLSPAETSQGLRRALNDAALVDGVSRTASVATVELDRTFDDLAPHEQVLALGQIVFTLTQRDEVDRVQFARGGEPLTIPTASGTLMDAPVSRYDYRSLR